MTKQITLAITGHRDIVETPALHEEINQYLEAIILENLEREVMLLSPLSDGADRFVAKIFLEKKKKYKQLTLVVPMPFTQERYMEDFDAASKKEFLELLALSDGNIRVPTYGDVPPYRGVGIYISQASDVLLALWDGTFNGKSGGTGDVVGYAKNMRYEVKHFLCERKAKNN